jgi:hypothetical protein
MGLSLSFINIKVNSLYYSKGDSIKLYKAYLTSISIPSIRKPSNI